MGVTRIDDLPERRLGQTVLDARQVAKERKGSPQLVSGANLAYLISASANAFDWTGLLDGSVGTPTYGQARFTITLSSSRATVPLVDVAMVVSYSTNGGASWIEYPYLQGLSDSYTGTSPEIFRTLTVSPGIENGPGQARYMLQLFGRLNTLAAFKLQVAGIDEVEITIARIA